MKQCHHCKTTLPGSARYCSHCGAPQIQVIESGSPPPINMEEALEPQLNRVFFSALRQKIEEEQPGADLGSYLERLHECGFFETLRLRVAQLAEEIRDLAHRFGAEHIRISRIIDRSFDSLLDYFLIHHCRDINVIPIPEAILKYVGESRGDADLYRMVLDYLDIDREIEDFYLSSAFLAMPVDMLRNAGKNFLFPEKDEKIFLICDQSMFGTCRSGFALTDRCLYWKASLQRSRKVPYAGIREVKREKEWLTINGHYFHVNPALDIKILKLMRRLKERLS